MYIAMATVARDLLIALRAAYGAPGLFGPRRTISGDEGAEAVRRGTSAIRMIFGEGMSGLTLRPDVARGFHLMGLMIYAVALPDTFVENLARKIVDGEEAENLDAARVMAEARWGKEQVAYRKAMHTLLMKVNDLEPRWPAVTTPRVN